MASRATYDAGAAALDFFARWMGDRQAKKEDRLARQEEDKRLEQALIERENRAEERARRRLETTPVTRKVYQGDNDQGPPELLADELNAIGAPVRTDSATQREKQDYASGMRNSVAANEAERTKQARIEEDRNFKREGELSRRANDTRRTNAAVSRVDKPTPTKNPSNLSKKEALAAISSFEYRADKEKGETWQDVAKRGGVDVDSLLSAANMGAKEKEPGALERGLNAVGGALKNAFTKKPEPILGAKSAKSDKKDAPPVQGAQKAPDGKWYVKQNGKWMLVEE